MTLENRTLYTLTQTVSRLPDMPNTVGIPKPDILIPETLQNWTFLILVLNDPVFEWSVFTEMFGFQIVLA